MRKAIALLALASCSAFADYSPLPPEQADYLQKKYSGVWGARADDGSINVTVEYSEYNYLTLLLDDQEALDAKVIDVDMDRDIVTVEFLSSSGNQALITLSLLSKYKMAIDVAGSGFQVGYIRRISQHDKDRIECLTAPAKVLDIPEVAKRCEAMGLN